MDDFFDDFFSLSNDLLGELNPSGNIMSNSWNVGTAFADILGDELGDPLQTLLAPLQVVSPNKNIFENAISLGAFAVKHLI